MDGTSDRVREQITAADAHLRAAHEAIKTALTLAQNAHPTEKDMDSALLEATELVGWSGQAHDGELIQLVAQADRFKTGRGGLVPWIATHLNVSEGAARGIAQSAREIGHLPQLSEALSSGKVGADTIRALTRTARAVKKTDQDLTAALTETLNLATTGSVTEAKRHVQILEETLNPGTAEKRLAHQRQRSFLRIIECESGMTRIEALLDDERATVVRAVIEGIVAGVLRARQYDGTELVPDDVQSIEQIQAHALTRLAEVYTDATPEQRAAPHTASVLYYTPIDPAELAGLAETPHSRFIPRNRLAPPHNPVTQLLEHIEGQPVRLNGHLLDQHPSARLATAPQRIALAWRDKHCTYPGCDRPPTWNLHAHHEEPFGPNGPTAMRNLSLLCSQHHVAIHHPRM